MKTKAFFFSTWIILLGCIFPGASAVLPLPDSQPFPCVLPCEDPMVEIFTGAPGIGLTDPDWSITTPWGTTVQALGTGLPPDYGWPDPFTGTNWISINHPPNADWGTYTFTHGFELSPNCLDPCLTLCVQVDDTALLKLNGNLIATIVDPGSVTVCNPAFFIIGGMNTLTVEVINNPAIYMGLNLRGWICCEPATLDTCQVICDYPSVAIFTGLPGIGAIDPAWSITQAGGTTLPAVGTILPAGFGWDPPFSGTNWISLNDPPAAGIGLYVFHHQFFMDSLCENPCLEMCIQVDDTALVFLNGNYLGIIGRGGFLSTCNAAFFNLSGPNSLDFHVVNNPGLYLGLNVKGWVCCNPAPPGTTIQCGADFWDHNMADGGVTSHFDGYTCDPANDHSAPDRMYILSVTGPGKLDISLTNYGNEADLDIFLLAAPMAGSCLDKSNSFGLGPENIIWDVPAGSHTYFIVVDGKVSPAYIGQGQFHLVALCMPTDLETCQLPCEDILDYLSSGMAPVGANDPRWTTLIYGPGTPVYVVPPPAFSGDDLPWSGTRWISPNYDNPLAAGTYSFFHPFLINFCLQPAIHLCVKVNDPGNLIRVYLNDNLIGGPVAGFLNLDYLSTSFFSMGSENILRIDIENLAESWFRINVQGYVCCDLDFGDIIGRVTYDGGAVAPITPSILVLMQGTSGIDTTFAAPDGNYAFSGVSPGVYSVKTQTIAPWGGVNATDALAILRHFTGVITLTGLAFQAADVNGNGYVNTSDALIVAKRFIGLIDSFPLGDWVFSSDPLTVVHGETTTHDIKGLCYGDVNKSYLLGARLQTNCHLEYSSLAYGQQGVLSFPIDILSTDNMGAVSLVLSFPSHLLDIREVLCIKPGTGANMLYAVANNELRISYFAPGATADNQLSFKVNAIVRQSLKTIDKPFELVYQEVANGYGTVSQDITLILPVIVSGLEELVLWPNPARDMLQVLIGASSGERVTLKLFNILGECVLIKELKGEARNSIDLMGWPNGVYVVQAHVHGLDACRVLRGRFERVD